MNSAQGRIVIGVDGSDASLDALRWALHQAHLTNCEVEAINSWHVPNEYAELVAGRIDWDANAQEILEDSLATVKNDEDVKVIRTVTEGHPAAVLTDASTNADLLVVGSRGHGGFAGMLLGSVSVHVSAHAHCPVVVIRHQGTQRGATE